MSEPTESHLSGVWKYVGGAIIAFSPVLLGVVLNHVNNANERIVTEMGQIRTEVSHLRGNVVGIEIGLKERQASAEAASCRLDATTKEHGALLGEIKERIVKIEATQAAKK
jgi:hypothetical protein